MSPSTSQSSGIFPACLSKTSGLWIVPPCSHPRFLTIPQLFRVILWIGWQWVIKPCQVRGGQKVHHTFWPSSSFPCTESLQSRMGEFSQAIQPSKAFLFACSWPQEGCFSKIETSYCAIPSSHFQDPYCVTVWHTAILWELRRILAVWELLFLLMYAKNIIAKCIICCNLHIHI